MEVVADCACACILDRRQQSQSQSQISTDTPAKGSEADAVRLIGMIHAAVLVDRRRHAASDTLPETLMLTVTPGLVCTNLMAHDLLLQPWDATNGSAAAVKVI